MSFLKPYEFNTGGKLGTSNCLESQQLMYVVNLTIVLLHLASTVAVS